MPIDQRGEDLEDRLLEFAARVGKLVDALPETRLGRHIAGQLVRSGTSPAPNYAEACAGESKKGLRSQTGNRSKGIARITYVDQTNTEIGDAL